MAKGTAQRGRAAGSGRAGRPQANGLAEAAPPAETFTIGDLSAEFSITTRTIRYYESVGLISPTRRGSTRIYSRRDRGRLILILRGKNLGFSLVEIGEYLALYDADRTGETQLKHLLAKVEAAIESLNSKRADIDRTLRELKEIRVKASELLTRMDRAG